MSFEKQKQALAQLLAEENDETKSLLLKVLIGQPTEMSKSVMQELSASKNGMVREGALKVLSSWGCPTARLELFLNAIRGNPLAEWEDLEQFNWDLCTAAHQEFEREKAVAHLDALAERVEAYYENQRKNALGQVQALQQVLGVEERFRGRMIDYYNPANCYLDLTFQTHSGLPVTLSMLYIFVGRRLGWNVYGVGVPSHYLAAIDKVVFDPFHAGIVLNDMHTAKQFNVKDVSCNCLLSFATTPLETAKRVMANLLKIYALYEDEERCRRANACLDELLDSR